MALTIDDDLKYDDSMKLALKRTSLNIPNKSDCSFKINTKQEELLQGKRKLSKN